MSYKCHITLEYLPNDFFFQSNLSKLIKHQDIQMKSIDKIKRKKKEKKNLKC